MKFSIGSQFSREFTQIEGNITNQLGDELNIFFQDKSYGDKVVKIYISVVCVSKGFEPFFPIRPLKVLRKEPAIEYEFKLDFKTFKSSDDNERRKILVDKLVSETKENLMRKTIKGFDKEDFIQDLEKFFHNYLD